jgi:hypothetical protein
VIDFNDSAGNDWLAVNQFSVVDALHHASCRGCTSMASFDERKFARNPHG